MAPSFQRVARITSKGQATIPKPVRDALGVREGDAVAFQLDDQGVVRLVRHHDESGEEAAVDAFLAFLSTDVKRRPASVTEAAKNMARRRELVAAINVDLDDDFADADAL